LAYPVRLPDAREHGAPAVTDSSPVSGFVRANADADSFGSGMARKLEDIIVASVLIPVDNV
jgi:hypothetical protein